MRVGNAGSARIHRRSDERSAPFCYPRGLARRPRAAGARTSGVCGALAVILTGSIMLMGWWNGNIHALASALWRSSSSITCVFELGRFDPFPNSGFEAETSPGALLPKAREMGPGADALLVGAPQRSGEC